MPEGTHEGVIQRNLVMAMVNTFPDWAMVQGGQGEAGIVQIHQGIIAYGATGAELARTYMLALLAAAYLREGNTATGLATLQKL